MSELFKNFDNYMQDHLGLAAIGGFIIGIAIFSLVTWLDNKLNNR